MLPNNATYTIAKHTILKIKLSRYVHTTFPLFYQVSMSWSPLQITIEKTETATREINTCLLINFVTLKFI